MQKAIDIARNRDWTRGRFSKHEFQVYGYRLAEELGDLRRKSLYIKLAKELPRGILEEALGFVKLSKAKSRARLFMWKLQEVRRQKEKGKTPIQTNLFETLESERPRNRRSEPVE